MSGCNSYVVPIIVPDPCDGDKKSTKCVIDENAFIELNLPANSTQEEINDAMYQALQAQALAISATVIINTTATPLSLTNLNTTYSTSTVGFKVYCTVIGLVYIKIADNTWVSQEITNVV
jgi:hypothetical protein